MAIDRFTGKLIDKPSDNLPSQTGKVCNECGTKLIDRCFQCGAPVCCPKCCDEATAEYQKPEKTI